MMIGKGVIVMRCVTFRACFRGGVKFTANIFSYRDAVVCDLHQKPAPAGGGHLYFTGGSSSKEPAGCRSNLLCNKYHVVVNTTRSRRLGLEWSKLRSASLKRMEPNAPYELVQWAISDSFRGRAGSYSS